MINSIGSNPFWLGRRNQNVNIDNTARIKNMYRRILGEIAVNRFKWEGLPESIDPRFLEMTLLYNGLSLFYYDEDYNKFFAVQATPSGTPNMYNNPISFTTYGSNFTTKILSAMPRIVKASGSETITLPEQCVPIWSNYHRQPDLDIIDIYSNKLGEWDRTIEINGNSARRTKIIAVPDNKRLSVRNINRLVDEGQGVIEISMNAMESLPIAMDLGINENTIEKLHIVRTRLWNECMGLLGINNANQDKKERLVSDEVGANDSQVSSIQSVSLNARKQAAYMINNRWGLNINVSFNEDIDSQINSVVSNTQDVRVTE